MTENTAEILQASPSSEASVSVWARLLRVSQKLLADVELDLKSAGLPPLVWYDILLELKRARPHNLRPFRLQNEMLIAQYNLSRLVDKMVSAEVITREPCEEDGRGHTLKITKRGLELQKKMWPIYQKAIETHFSAHLEAPDLQALAAILAKCNTR